MNPPLYRQAVTERPCYKTDSHAGLWWDKFFNGWADTFSEIEKPPKSSSGNKGKSKGGKRDFINILAGKTVGHKPAIEAFNKRQEKLLSALGCEPLSFVLQSPFVTGLGYDHPVENGFAWHPVLGTPFMPGSSVKGLLRAWASWYAQTKNEAALQARVDRLFGEDHAGELIVFDAIPEGPVKLMCEIITPHDGGWRIKDDLEVKVTPADWVDPVPIPFLAVASGATFRFGLASRRRAANLTEVKSWLTEALDWLGAGAKTNVGFGRFLDEETHERRKEEKRRKDEARKEAERKCPWHPQVDEEVLSIGDEVATVIELQDEEAKVRFLDGTTYMVKIEDLKPHNRTRG